VLKRECEVTKILIMHGKRPVAEMWDGTAYEGSEQIWKFYSPANATLNATMIRARNEIAVKSTP
jgi:hypothetical protein